MSATSGAWDLWYSATGPADIERLSTGGQKRFFVDSNTDGGTTAAVATPAVVQSSNTAEDVEDTPESAAQLLLEAVEAVDDTPEGSEEAFAAPEEASTAPEKASTTPEDAHMAPDEASTVPDEVTTRQDMQNPTIRPKKTATQRLEAELKVDGKPSLLAKPEDAQPSKQVAVYKHQGKWYEKTDTDDTSLYEAEGFRPRFGSSTTQDDAGATKTRSGRVSKKTKKAQ